MIILNNSQIEHTAGGQRHDKKNWHAPSPPTKTARDATHTPADGIQRTNQKHSQLTAAQHASIL